MAFDYAALMEDLFPSARPARALREPPGAGQGCRPAPSSLAPPRPRNRLLAALRSPSLLEWSTRWQQPPNTIPPPPPCWRCGSRVFWLSPFGVCRCGRCHPPACPGLAASWLRVVPTEDGPQVVRLGNPPSKA